MKKSATAREKLRFVIQKHSASRLHYDLRLELDGVYKSWAVTRGPSLDPEEKRLSVHVEDHPIEYGDFEGIIPKGEYGGGTVMIWDRGYWTPEIDAAEAYAKGHIAFDFYGEKLHGRWHLIRLKPKPREKQQAWLLFKSEDGFSRPTADGDILQDAPNSVATGRSLDGIASEKAAVWSSKGQGLVEGDLSPAMSGGEKTKPTRKNAHGVKLPAAGLAISGHGHNFRHAQSSSPRRRATMPERLHDPVMNSGVNAGARAGPRGNDASAMEVISDKFPGFIAPCLAQLADAAPTGDDWLHEIKFDGYRLIGLIDRGRVQLMTRSGLDWTERFPAIAAALAKVPVKSAVVDGEAIIEDAHGISNFSALQEALSDGRCAKEAILFAFDLMYLNGRDLRRLSLDERKTLLAPLIGDASLPALRYSDHLVADGDAMAQHACRLGLEGIISKKRSAPYRSGRGGEWLKIKCTNRSEFVIGGYAPSSATRNAIGSLALGYYRDGKLIHIGRAGTGFTQKMAQSLYKQLQTLKSSHSPFVSALTADEKRNLVFVEPELVADVEFRGWTADKHLRHAAFKGLREDKAAREVELEGNGRSPAVIGRGNMNGGKRGKTNDEIPHRIKASEKEAMPHPVKMSAGATFEGVKLTHPDRILWAEQGLTKLGLAEYYAEVADWILPYIINRPLSLVRCPGGSDGECFFQKHKFAGLTDAVEVVPLPEQEGIDEALVIRDLRGLISLVQANVLEIHPWGSAIDDVEHPDRIIFDLDPGEGVSWEAVIAAAFEVRQRLQDAGLEPFVKTTGGKGLHVVATLKPEETWDAVKDFTRNIAISMEQDSPSLYLSTMTKKARTGKIFIDYLRNGRGATAVAAYSTRARPGAPVSTPITWDELGPAITANRFDTGNLPGRLASLKADPWLRFAESGGRLATSNGTIAKNRKSSSPRGRRQVG